MKISLSLEYAESGTLAERLHAVAEAGIPAVNLGTSQIRHLLATAPSETELLNEQITGHGLAVDWVHYLPAYLNKISSLHIHDNHGEVDEHLIPGDGTIDFSALLSGLHSTGYNGYLGVECVQRVSDYPGDFLSLASLIKTRMSRLEN
jgi:hypothetical protein